MATWHNREELEQLVITLSKQGVSRRAIARTAGVSRNTVKALLDAHETARESACEPGIASPPARTPRASKLDTFKPRITEVMARFNEITSQRVFEILRAEGFPGGYTAVKEYIRAVRPPPKPTPSLVTPGYLPGEMAESDWSPYEMQFTTGRKAIVQALSYVLVTSKRKFFELYESNDLHALMDGHALAFARFDACAQQCKYDSQKPVVLRWEGNQPIYNPRFLAFSSYYEFRPLAVRRGHPNDKPRTERSFWEVERSFLNGREFRDLDDMRAQLKLWLDTIVDHRRLEKRTALERFAEEREHLVPLPRHPYDTARVIYRLCSIDGFVAWAGNRYAIPYDHVTDILPVRITQRELFVYAADLRCIARHELAPRGAGLKLDPAQFHRPPQRKSAIDLDQLRLAFESMGERSTEFFRLMSQAAPRVWGAQGRQILLLRERYATLDLDLALGHAAQFGALGCAAVERILASRAAPRTLDEYVAEETARRIEITLGHARTEPRDLTEYDRLPPLSSGVSAKENACPSETDTADPNPTRTSSASASSDTSNSSDST
ncbi:MAG TPA: IS21 family transposase [Burkholderiales bacterium]|nr:IS21 family transposase [Burkholderiales bacterium]